MKLEPGLGSAYASNYCNDELIKYGKVELKKAMNKLLINILIAVLLNGCIMTGVDSITVKNNSTFTMDVLINENYPDTTLHKTRYIKLAINPAEEGPLGLVNKKWEEHLRMNDKVTLFFVQSKPQFFYDSGRRGEQKVYGKLILSQTILDSLGRKIVFPDDIE